MNRFDFLFRIVLAELILGHSDNLSKSLQHSTLSAAAGQNITAKTVETLQSIRTTESFDLLWQKMLQTAEHLEVSELVLLRRKKAPKLFESGNAQAKFPAMCKDMYMQTYLLSLKHWIVPLPVSQTGLINKDIKPTESYWIS